MLTLITNGYRKLLQDAGGADLVHNRDPDDGPGLGAEAGGERRLLTTASRRSLPACPSESRIRSSGCTTSAARWTGSSPRSRPSPATRLAQLSGFAPPMLLALGSRLATRSARLNMDTATTNVPALSFRCTLDRRLLASYPYVPIVGVHPDRGRDLLVRRPAVLRGDRGQGPCPGRRHPHRRASRPTSTACSRAEAQSRPSHARRSRHRRPGAELGSGPRLR